MGLVSELRRRNVFRMAVLYAVAAWLIMQVADVLIDLAKLPDWIGTTTLGLLAVGFPIALVFSWFYELTPEGISLEKDVGSGESITHVTGRRLDFIVISLLCAAVILFAYDKWWVGPPPEQSIAVLPFSNRSAMAEDAYFVDGIHDDILTQLAKISSFGKVISRTSTEHYRDTSKPIAQIGQELGVATILEGGVQRAGDRVRINVQLIEAATDKHLWAETYDRQLTVENIFRVQEEIARAVTGSLRVTLTPEEHDMLAKLPTGSLEAYRLYQLGYKANNSTGTAEANERAIGYLEEAIRVDPEYAQAYAELASAYVIQHYVGGRSRKEALKQARPLAEHAIKLDPALAEGYVTLGLINRLELQWEAAESNYDSAIALNPDLAVARWEYGLYLESSERLDEAIIQLEEATRLSPLEAHFYSMLAYTYAEANRSQEALDTLHHALELDPDVPFVYETFGDVYGLFLGRLDQAVKWHTKGLQREPDSVRLRPFIAAFYLDLGDIPTARLLIEQQIDPAMHGQVRAETLQLALLMYLRQYEEALKFAEEDWQRWGPQVDRLLQDLYSLDGQYQRALEINDQRIQLYSDVVPHPETSVTGGNLTVAIYRAAILAAMGEDARSQRLLRNCLEVAKTERIHPGYLSGNYRLVQIYALLGDVPNALLALRESIDAGSRSGWWVDLLHSPITASLRNEPQFQEMVEEIRADMATQLANVREMQRTGEMPPLPVVNH
jgi:TolB-like protein/Tfp pilus assembly protein PilF